MAGMWSFDNDFLLFFFQVSFHQLKPIESFGNHKLSEVIQTATILRFHFRTFNDMLQESKHLP